MQRRRLCVSIRDTASLQHSACCSVCSGYTQERGKYEKIDGLGSDPSLSCDTYITFYCTNFLPNGTKYQTQYFSHTVSLCFTNTYIKISRWTADQSKTELKRTKIIPETASVQFLFLSVEMNYRGFLAFCKQTRFFFSHARAKARFWTQHDVT